MFESRNLKIWFLQNKRAFPWREDPTPYKVWVSEIMLQQTQASVVVPYFERWMQLFPTISDLARASLDQVIKAWEGLGYYSRARYLHAGSQQVASNYGGRLPDQCEELQKIKGIGPYTLGAISSFAFHQKAAAVDGNVIRVLTRYFQIEDDVSKPKVVNQLRELAEKILPDEEPWVIVEALIELGALICTRKPNCYRCPLQPSCRAFANGLENNLPFKSAKTTYISLYRSVAVISHGDKLLVRRGEKGEIMSDLHEFPYFDTDSNGIPDDVLDKKIEETYGLQVQLQSKLPSVSHSFTRYRVRLEPVQFSINTNKQVSGFEWRSISELKNLAFSSGHRRIFEFFCSKL